MLNDCGYIPETDLIVIINPSHAVVSHEYAMAHYI